MKGFKGFKIDLTCNGFQFKEGESFEHKGKVSLCNSGFHFCENPLDCFNYYKPGDSVFHEVEAEGVTDETKDDSKRVAKKISIGAAVSIGDIVKAAVKFIFSKAEVSETGSATSGDGANSATSGDGANSATSGYGANSATSGDGANSATSGDGANSATSGYGANSATSGDGANSATSGYGANSATSGKWANSAALGDNSSAEVKEAESVAVVTGRNSKARGALGCWLVLTERDDEFTVKCVKAVKVDGKKILPGVWYALKSRKVVQVEE